jgi:hypothetical protein
MAPAMMPFSTNCATLTMAGMPVQLTSSNLNAPLSA